MDAMMATPGSRRGLSERAALLEEELRHTPLPQLRKNLQSLLTEKADALRMLHTATHTLERMAAATEALETSSAGYRARLELLQPLMEAVRVSTFAPEMRVAREALAAMAAVAPAHALTHSAHAPASPSTPSNIASSGTSFAYTPPPTRDLYLLPPEQLAGLLVEPAQPPPPPFPHPDAHARAGARTPVEAQFMTGASTAAAGELGPGTLPQSTSGESAFVSAHTHMLPAHRSSYTQIHALAHPSVSAHGGVITRAVPPPSRDRMRVSATQEAPRSSVHFLDATAITDAAVPTRLLYAHPHAYALSQTHGLVSTQGDAPVSPALSAPEHAQTVHVAAALGPVDGSLDGSAPSYPTAPHVAASNYHDAAPARHAYAGGVTAVAAASTTAPAAPDKTSPVRPLSSSGLPPIPMTVSAGDTAIRSTEVKTAPASAQDASSAAIGADPTEAARAAIAEARERARARAEAAERFVTELRDSLKRQTEPSDASAAPTVSTPAPASSVLVDQPIEPQRVASALSADVATALPEHSTSVVSNQAGASNTTAPDVVPVVPSTAVAAAPPAVPAAASLESTSAPQPSLAPSAAAVAEAQQARADTQYAQPPATAEEPSSSTAQPAAGGEDVFTARARELAEVAAMFSGSSTQQQPSTSDAPQPLSVSSSTPSQTPVEPGTPSATTGRTLRTRMRSMGSAAFAAARTSEIAPPPPGISPMRRMTSQASMGDNLLSPSESPSTPGSRPSPAAVLPSPDATSSATAAAARSTSAFRPPTSSEDGAPAVVVATRSAADVVAAATSLEPVSEAASEGASYSPSGVSTVAGLSPVPSPAVSHAEGFESRLRGLLASMHQPSSEHGYGSDDDLLRELASTEGRGRSGTRTSIVSTSKQHHAAATGASQPSLTGESYAQAAPAATAPSVASYATYHLTTGGLQPNVSAAASGEHRTASAPRNESKTASAHAVQHADHTAVTKPPRKSIQHEAGGVSGSRNDVGSGVSQPSKTPEVFLSATRTKRTSGTASTPPAAAGAVPRKPFEVIPAETSAELEALLEAAGSLARATAAADVTVGTTTTVVTAASTAMASAVAEMDMASHPRGGRRRSSHSTAAHITEATTMASALISAAAQFHKSSTTPVPSLAVPTGTSPASTALSDTARKVLDDDPTESDAAIEARRRALLEAKSRGVSGPAHALTHAAATSGAPASRPKRHSASAAAGQPQSAPGQPQAAPGQPPAAPGQAWTITTRTHKHDAAPTAAAPSRTAALPPRPRAPGTSSGSKPASAPTASAAPPAPPSAAQGHAALGSSMFLKPRRRASAI